MPSTPSLRSRITIAAVTLLLTGILCLAIVTRLNSRAQAPAAAVAGRSTASAVHGVNHTASRLATGSDLR